MYPTAAKTISTIITKMMMKIVSSLVGPDEGVGVGVGVGGVGPGGVGVGVGVTSV